MNALEDPGPLASNVRLTVSQPVTIVFDVLKCMDAIGLDTAARACQHLLTNTLAVYRSLQILATFRTTLRPACAALRMTSNSERDAVIDLGHIGRSRDQARWSPSSDSCRAIPLAAPGLIGLPKWIKRYLASGFPKYAVVLRPATACSRRHRGTC